MTRHILFAASLAVCSFGAAACKDVTCGDGTIERQGACVPADETVGSAGCGPFTTLQGDKCVPMFDPTECDPATTMPVMDPATGVTTCVGTGGGGSCTSPFQCMAPDADKQTVCGQILDLLDDSPFAAAGATGVRCTTPTATGPCALGIKAFDAISFANNPTGATPLTVGDVYIDDCGRYRMTNIHPPGGPYIALGFDDAAAAMAGPTGITHAVGVALNTDSGKAIANFDAFVAASTTTDMWTASGGPTTAGGMYINIFRAKQDVKDRTPQAGVTFLRANNPVPNDDYYFAPNDIGRHTIMAGATATGMNGTVIVTNAKLSDGNNSGSGGLDATCVWQLHPGSTIPNALFVQVKRPQDNFMGDVCDR